MQKLFVGNNNSIESSMSLRWNWKWHHQYSPSQPPRSYLLADSTALWIALAIHKCICGVAIFDNSADLAFSMATDAAVCWAYFLAGNKLKLRSSASLVSTILLIALVGMDALFFVAAGVPVRTESLELLITQFFVVIQNFGMLPSSSLYIGLTAATTAICSFFFVRIVVKFNFKHSALKNLSKAAVTNAGTFGMLCFILFSIGALQRYGHPNVMVRLCLELISRWNASTSRPSFVWEELLYLGREKEFLVNSPHPSTSLFIISLESVRASALGAYNKDIPTELTPFLSSLVRSEGTTIVQNLISSVPNTMKVLYSAMCGVPAHPSVQSIEYEKESPYLAHCLPRLLGDMGWSTRFFTSSTVGFQPRLGFEYSLDGGNIVREAVRKHEFQPFQRASFLGYDERVILSPLKTWLSTLEDTTPAFAMIGTLSTHAPYTLANSSRAKKISSTVRRAVDKTFRRQAELPILDNELEKEQYAAYLTAIHETDYFIKDVIQTIEQSRKSEDSIVVIVGDHGEAFFEHPGSHFHGGTPYSEQVHVPCFIVDRREKKQLNGGTILKAWSVMSLRWTLLKFIGFESFVERVNPPSSLPYPHAIGSKQKAKQNKVCSAISSGLLDERAMACSVGNLKIMVLQEPYRIKVFNTTSDPWERHELRVYPKSVVRSAINEMLLVRKTSRNRHREISGLVYTTPLKKL